jgi:hypothetical protein
MHFIGSIMKELNDLLINEGIPEEALEPARIMLKAFCNETFCTSGYPMSAQKFLDDTAEDPEFVGSGLIALEINNLLIREQEEEDYFVTAKLQELYNKNIHLF